MKLATNKKKDKTFVKFTRPVAHCAYNYNISKVFTINALCIVANLVTKENLSQKGAISRSSLYSVYCTNRDQTQAEFSAKLILAINSDIRKIKPN